MADTKISALTASTVPLAGTEVLPIVQGGVTKQVSIVNLTAGRNVSVSGGTITSGGVLRSFRPDNAIYTDQYMAAGAGGGYIFNNANGDGFKWQFGGVDQMSVTTSGNLAFPSGQGIDFSATAGTGTSELLADYEEGVFTATLTCTSGTITLNSSQDQMQYTKIGRVVYISGQIGVTSISSPTGSLKLAGLPFTTSNSLGELAGRGAGTVVADTVANTINNTVLTFLSNSTVMTIEKYAAGVQANMAADVSASSSFWINAWYVAA